MQNPSQTIISMLRSAIKNYLEKKNKEQIQKRRVLKGDYFTAFQCRKNKKAERKEENKKIARIHQYKNY